ncbi:unnamed protein product [Urochloa humidicola]
MAASSQSASASATDSLAPYRDAQGYLPLQSCSKCGTMVIGRVSQQPKSRGQRFYKCPLFEHTGMACKFFMFEGEYVEYLVSLGVLPRSCSKLKGREADLVGIESLNQANRVLKEAIDGVECCHDILQVAISKLKVAEDALKNAGSSKMALESKVDRIGERLVVLGLANLVFVVLVLMVLLIK